MSEFTPGILLCTNGSGLSRPSLEYGVWLADLLRLPVTLLGVVEREDNRKLVENALEETAQDLLDREIRFRMEFDIGRGSVVIARHASRGGFITVVGPLGRQVIRRAVQGRSFRRLLERIETPLVYVPHLRLPLRRVVICMGGLGYAQSVVRQCCYIAQAAGAQVTLLHVVEPVTMDYPIAREVEEHWENILATDTPQSRNLRHADEELKKAGLTTTVKIRHGNAVHEILTELNEGEYQLIGLGSPHSTHSLRHYYLPNVTAEVAEVAGVPVMTARLGHEIVLKS